MDITDNNTIVLTKASSGSDIVMSRYDVTVDGKNIGSVRSTRGVNKKFNRTTVWKVSNPFNPTVRSITAEFATRKQAVDFLVKNA